MTLSLDQLLVLDAIEREGSFTGAGVALRRATSAVSYAVKQLEVSLGLELFDRSQHKATLTSAGVSLLAEAREVIARARALEQTAERLRGGWEAKLVFVVDGFVPMRPIMLAVKRFTQLSEVTRLEVHVEGYRSCWSRFRELDADLLLTLSDDENADDRERVRALPLPPLEVILVAAEGHPLAMEERFTAFDLARHVEVRAADGPVKRVLSDSTFVLSDVGAQRDAILEGVGFGWVPRHLVEADIRARRVRLVTFEEGFRVRRIPRIVHARDRRLGLAAEAFTDTLRSEIDALVRGPRRRVRSSK